MDNRYSDFKIDIVTHILLLIFTLGIWYFIWIYKTTDNLNRIPGVEQRNPTNKLLLCIFVPFYSIYWTYVTAQIVDKFSTDNGNPSDMAVIDTVLDIFTDIVAAVLIQNSINSAVEFIESNNNYRDNINYNNSNYNNNYNNNMNV